MVFFNNEQRIVDPKLILPFCRTFRHIVGSSPGKCSRGFSVRQSAMGNEVLSKGSAHLGSPSDLHTQHLIDSPIKIKNQNVFIVLLPNHMYLSVCPKCRWRQSLQLSRTKRPDSFLDEKEGPGKPFCSFVTNYQRNFLVVVELVAWAGCRCVLNPGRAGKLYTCQVPESSKR